MRAKTYEYRWHWCADTKSPTPIFSTDFQHYGGQVWRMATAGADKTVKIWKVVHDDDKVKPTPEQIATATAVSETAKLASDAAQAEAAAAMAAKDESDSGNGTPTAAATAAAAAAVASAVSAANAAAAAAAAVPVESDECPDITFMSELSRHTGAVNCVRFSPDGRWLASAGDDHTILVWGLDTAAGGKSVGNMMQSDNEAENVEHWRVNATLRGHREDIFDLAWSPNSKRLLSGSVDNTAIVWDVADLSKVKQIQHIKDHKHFVQGVAWHPGNSCIITQSSDRSLKVYEQRKKQYICVTTTTKMAVPATEAVGEKVAEEGGGGAAAAAAEGDGAGGMDTAHDDDATATSTTTTPTTTTATATTTTTVADAATAAAAAAASIVAESESVPKSTVNLTAAATAAAATTATTAATTTSTATAPATATLAEGKAGTPAPAEATTAAAAAAAKPKMRSERLFVDETRTAFFRRLTFTPDGTMFIAAAGRHAMEDGTEENAAYLFRTSMPEVPIVRLGGMQSPVVCARACPLYFAPKHLNYAVEQPQIFANLEHRMIFAIATADTVFLYDTEQLAPFATVAHLHYASITDLAWSADAKMLAITSQDGYCSMVAFNQGELGVVSTTMPPLMMEAPVEEVVGAGAAAVTASTKESNSTPQSPVPSDTTAAESDVAMGAGGGSSSSSSSSSNGGGGAVGDKPARKRINPTLITMTGQASSSSSGKKRISPTLITAVNKNSSASASNGTGNNSNVDACSPQKNKAAKQPESAEQPKAKARRITPMLISTNSPSSNTVAAATATATATATTKKRIAPTLLSTPTPTN